MFDIVRKLRTIVYKFVVQWVSEIVDEIRVYMKIERMMIWLLFLAYIRVVHYNLDFQSEKRGGEVWGGEKSDFTVKAFSHIWNIAFYFALLFTSLSSEHRARAHDDEKKRRGKIYLFNIYRRIHHHVELRWGCWSSNGKRSCGIKGEKEERN